MNGKFGEWREGHYCCWWGGGLLLYINWRLLSTFYQQQPGRLFLPYLLNLDEILCFVWHLSVQLRCVKPTKPYCQEIQICGSIVQFFRCSFFSEADSRMCDRLCRVNGLVRDTGAHKFLCNFFLIYSFYTISK